MRNPPIPQRNITIIPVITAISIIEVILLQELRKNNLQPRKKYTQIESRVISAIKEDGILFNILQVKQKLSNHVIHRPGLEKIIKNAVKYKLFGLDKSNYLELNQLRKLRNKVHLETNETYASHDYNSFDFGTYHLVTKYLKIIFSQMLNEDVFDFL